MDCEKVGNHTYTEEATPALMTTIEELTPAIQTRVQKWRSLSRQIPRTSEARLSSSQSTEHDTVFYLGYGSNLAAETFLGKRGIRPLSQVNIVAPAMQLTFDLPGIPYSEPCFANSKYRDTSENDPKPDRPPYHKDAWKKGLVGVAYEVTKKDFAHIIATEGGGSNYHDVLVDCYALDPNPDLEVPKTPSGTSFKAHTLYAHNGEALRPNPDYAQPSPRYLKLITDGAGEHDLPKEYRFFLENIRTFHTTTSRQMVGRFVLLAVWGPFFIFLLFGAGKIFLRKDGTYPAWFARLTTALFAAVWASYDNWFYGIFGDGERTIGGDVANKQGSQREKDTPLKLDHNKACEKTPLLEAE